MQPSVFGLRRAPYTPAARKRRERLKARFGGKPVKRSSQWSLPRIGISVATISLLSVLLCIHLLPGRVSWRLGDTADRDIIAARTVRYEDTGATARLRADAAAQVDARYEELPGASLAASEKVRALFDHLDQGFAQPTSALPSADAKPATSPLDISSLVGAVALEQLRRQTKDDRILPSASDIALLARQSLTVRNNARAFAVRLVEREMGRAISEGTDDLSEARAAVLRVPAPAGLSPAVAHVAATVARAALEPTRRGNLRETDRARQTAMTQIPLQMRRLPAGTVVIRSGEMVTQQHLDAFAALGLRNDRLDATAVLTIILLVIFLTGLAIVYLRQFHPELYDDTSRLLLLAILTVFSVVGLKIGSALLGLSTSVLHFGYLGMMSVASAGMVIALLISPRIATLIVALLAVASGLILNNELRYTLITLGSSLVGIISVSTLRNRGDLLRAAALLCVSNAFLNALVGQMEGDLPRELLQGAMWGIVSGLFALFMFYIGVAIFEKWFGLTTHLRLLELTDPATPVLQDFRMQVPGTYAHSLMVSNLASAAAEAIGADALLVRVAAYYHDIGKMNRPEFFIENQANADNVHDRIAPSLSAIILASHVKEGLEIAEQLGLPPKVREIMSQHHGTTLMKYFYHRATGGQSDSSLEAQFRYPGPKPQTREAAILMLADTVEAASRTLQRPTPSRIAEFIAKLVEDKRADGQLDECDLTLRDVATCEAVFTRILSGALHARIDYPSDEKRPAPPATPPAFILNSFPDAAGGIVSPPGPPHPTDVKAAVDAGECLPGGIQLPPLKAAITDDTGLDPLTLASGAFPDDAEEAPTVISTPLASSPDDLPLTTSYGTASANSASPAATDVDPSRLSNFPRRSGKTARKRR